MKNSFAVVILLILMVAFGVFIHVINLKDEVIDIISPSKIVVDKNKNKIKDSGEVFCIAKIE